MAVDPRDKARRSSWIATVAYLLIAALLVASIGLGVALIGSQLSESSTRLAIGVQLLGGAIAAIAIFLAGALLSVGQRKLHNRQALVISLSLERNLQGITLAGERLAGVNLRYKTLVNANLEEA